jgi:hypothetical protein
MEAQEPARALRELYRPAASAPLLEPTQRVEAERVMQLICAEPFVERAGQVVLVVERHRLDVRREVEM